MRKSYVAESVPAHGEHIYSYIKQSVSSISQGYTELNNIHLSSSGLGKFELYVNSERIATLFNGHQNYNCYYPFPVRLTNSEYFKVHFINRDYQAQDMYLSFEET